jgi:HSP20 family molecular chaperone IbpA
MYSFLLSSSVNEAKQKTGQQLFWDTLIEPYMNYRSTVWDYTLGETPYQYSISLNANGLDRNSIKVEVRYNKIHIYARFLISKDPWQRRDYSQTPYYRQFPLPVFADYDRLKISFLYGRVIISIPKKILSNTIVPGKYAAQIMHNNFVRKLYSKLAIFFRRTFHL